MKATVLALLLLGSSAVAGDEALHAELAALKAELARLQAQVVALEARVAAAPDEQASEGDRDPVTVAAAAPDPDPVPRAQISAGGRIKFDLVFNELSSGSGSSGDTSLNVGAIPLDSDGERGQVNFSGRSSRLWLKSWTPTALGDAGAYLEFDLYGGGGNERVTNSYNVRLRHGYGEFAGFTFGQTYTTFMDVSALPELNDDGGSAGASFARQPLLRYTRPFAGANLSVALESPEITLVTANSLNFAPDDDRLPDFVARYQRSGYWGSWSLAALARELRIDDLTLAAHDAVFGFGANVSAYVVLGAEDSLSLNIGGGDGVGRYMNLNAFADARLDRAGTLEATPMVGGFVAWQHWWTRTWRSNLAAGYAWQDDDGARDGENEQLASLHANLLWSPVSSTTLGLEWIAARRQLVDGQHNALWRLQFSAVHKF